MWFLLRDILIHWVHYPGKCIIFVLWLFFIDWISSCITSSNELCTRTQTWYTLCIENVIYTHTILAFNVHSYNCYTETYSKSKGKNVYAVLSRSQQNTKVFFFVIKNFSYRRQFMRNRWNPKECNHIMRSFIHAPTYAPDANSIKLWIILFRMVAKTMDMNHEWDTRCVIDIFVVIDGYTKQTAPSAWITSARHGDVCIDWESRTIYTTYKATFIRRKKIEKAYPCMEAYYWYFFCLV